MAALSRLPALRGNPYHPRMNASHDVLVVGGGLVGASLAIALDRLDLDVGLVEVTPPGALPPVFDQRNLSLADASVNALTALDVMRHLRAPTGAIREIHASRKGDFGRVRMRAADYGRQTFGQVVVARDFGEALEARLATLTRLRRYRPARFLGATADTGGCTIRIEAGGGEARSTARCWRSSRPASIFGKSRHSATSPPFAALVPASPPSCTPS